MPFRGRPSRGCQTCRRRKIKCDLREGGCETCEKAGWKCEGYRDISALMFHDESAKVIRKATAAEQQQGSRRRGVGGGGGGGAGARGEKAPDSGPASAASSSNTSSPVLPPHQTALIPFLSDQQQQHYSVCSPSPPQLSILPELDHLALGYFFDKYVFKYQDRRDFWDVEDGNGCLLAAIKALGTAGVTKQIGQGPSSSDPEARKHYLTALQRTNAALRDPEGVKRDSTLLAIMILSIYETVSGFRKSLDSWRDHVNGAASLLQLRGPEQFDTQTGCRLFLQTCQNLIISCLSRRLPIPEHVRIMQQIAEQYIPDPKESVWRFHLASMRVADLNARLLPGNYPVSSTQAPVIITDALAFYAEMESILADAPDNWKPQFVSATGPVVYSDYYYVFDSYLVAQIFCGLCSYRIMLTDILRKAVANCRTSGRPIPPAQWEQIQYCLGSVKALQLSILAVIPQHLGDKFPITHIPTPGQPDQTWKNFTSRDHNPFRGARTVGRDLPFVRMSGGYQVQFPLFTAGAADPPGGPIRVWAIGVLKLLSQTVGIQQASILANQLEEDGDRIPEEMWHCTCPA